MKAVTIFLVVLTLAAICVGGYTMYTATLTVKAQTARVYSGTEMPTDFVHWREKLENNAVEGVAFKTSMPGNAEDYSFIVYTLTIENKCLLPAEMLELQISPKADDVLCYTQPGATGMTVAPGQTQSVWGVLLTKAGANAVRDLYVTYYIWGRPFSVKVTYG